MNDRTDEDLFRCLPPGSHAVHVGMGLSRAPFRLPDPAATREVLWRFHAI